VSAPSNAQLVADVQRVLSVATSDADQIVQAFDEFVARPLESNLKKLRGRDLARRNPMIYTARGATSVDDWTDRVLADKETSAIESHIGTWMEEVSRIISGGFKPGSGVDLQRDSRDHPGTIELYAIQSAPNTKSAGGRRSDVRALQQAAAVLRASRRRVELNIAVLSGRSKTTALAADPNISLLGSDDFWHRVSGIPDFRARLIRATAVLSALVRGRAASEVARIKREAQELFGDSQGNLRLDVLADPPKATRRRTARPGS
jgi:hypothetical protein